jgi:cytochrome c-type biogenesis protein CcmH/NrfG
MEAGDLVKAAGAYRQALDLTPDDDEIKLALARAYNGQGKQDFAPVVLEQRIRGPNMSSL